MAAEQDDPPQIVCMLAKALPGLHFFQVAKKL